MRKNFGAKPMCYPMPVYIIGTYNADGTPNAMNAAWGGISEETEISICVDSAHKTAENVAARKAFTVSMATAQYVTTCDYEGIVSGSKEPDKFARAGFHAVKSEFVDAPLIEELPMALECELVSYDPETCRLVGRILQCPLAAAGRRGRTGHFPRLHQVSAPTVLVPSGHQRRARLSGRNYYAQVR